MAQRSKKGRASFTAEEMTLALDLELEATHRLSEEISSIACAQEEPSALALHLNQERALHGQQPILKDDEEEKEVEGGCGGLDAASKKKRPREGEEPTTSTLAVTATEENDEEEGTAVRVEEGSKKKRRKREKESQQENDTIAALRESSLQLMQARIPAKIVLLNALHLELTVSQAEALAPSVVRQASLPFASNSRTRELVDMVKTELTDLMDIVSAVRLWLQFSIPPAAGEDFDAKIKERIAEELRGVNESGVSVINTLKQYPLSRGLLITQLKKHPEVEDFRHGLPFMDFGHQLAVKRWLKDLRNVYLSLNTTLKQNVAELSQRWATDKDTQSKRRGGSSPRQIQGRGAGRRTSQYSNRS